MSNEDLRRLPLRRPLHGSGGEVNCKQGGRVRTGGLVPWIAPEESNLVKERPAQPPRMRPRAVVPAVVQPPARQCFFGELSPMVLGGFRQRVVNALRRHGRRNGLRRAPTRIKNMARAKPVLSQNGVGPSDERRMGPTGNRGIFPA